ncbi:DUF2909 domain-containing protein [Vreelandella massiliensis]|uniref:DUF2909 domain-containing protein n=1 Tax=Vreelandella massiliensis TaxID=1816686 RepID=UPI00096A4A97|nr:DUF2909 domain-containing protein [Halomonas massiliensis]MYL24147.1 DUF2909 family protein [Halomonas alkaliantarctica]
MLLKILIVIVFSAIVISLALGSRFLLYDSPTSRRLLTALKWRIGLTVCLIILIIYGFWSGILV